MMQNRMSFGNIQNLTKRNGLYICSFILLLSALPVISKCPKCSTKDIQTIQLKCSVEDENLIQAEAEFDIAGNNTKFCRMLYTYYFCVGNNVPYCVETITENYISYHSSPYDCHPTMEDTVKLQGYLFSCDATTTGSTTHSQDMTVVVVQRSTTTSKTKTQKTSSHGLNNACVKGFSSILGLFSAAIVLISHRLGLS